MTQGAAAWNRIWSDASSRELWSVPDRRVVATIQQWKGDGRIARVLDAGCGVGRHTGLLAREGFEVYACDRSAQAVEACRTAVDQTGCHATIWQGDVAATQYRSFFDAVIAFNVVYHGTEGEVRGALRQLRDVLRPGGECFVTFPSRRNRLYGQGRQIEPHTFVATGMFPGLFARAEQGIPHHFVEDGDLCALFEDFEIISLDHSELWLPSRSRTSKADAWFRVPQLYFWTVVARRGESPATA